MENRGSGNCNVPKEVLRLMQKERRSMLKASYYEMLERMLDQNGARHWGISLQAKMAKYPVESWLALKSWARKHDIPFSYKYTPWDTFKYMLENANQE